MIEARRSNAVRSEMEIAVVQRLHLFFRGFIPVASLAVPHLLRKKRRRVISLLVVLLLVPLQVVRKLQVSVLRLRLQRTQVMQLLLLLVLLYLD